MRMNARNAKSALVRFARLFVVIAISINAINPAFAASKVSQSEGIKYDI